jgi:Spy/CpxP family protein refolding chaperone
MHPAFYSWWKHARRHAWQNANACQAGHDGHDGHGGHGGHGQSASEGGFCGPGRDGDDGPPFGHGPGHGHGHGHGGPDGPGPGGPGRFGGRFSGGPPDDGGVFGVRRPLRFLAHKLELTEAQVSVLARILDELKTERAQAEVDNRRTVSAFADALESAEFGEARSREGADLRVKSAERLREAVTLALSRIHTLLEEEQRKRLSYLIRTGVVSL